MPRKFSEQFPDILNQQEAPFMSAPEVEAARSARPLPILGKEHKFEYSALPIFYRQPLRKEKQFGLEVQDDEFQYRGWEFYLKKFTYRTEGDEVVSTTERWFDKKYFGIDTTSNLDTDAFLSQFKSKTYEGGISFLKSLGIKFSVTPACEYWKL